MCWGSSPSSATLQSCCQEFAALWECSVSQQQGNSQDPLCLICHLSHPSGLGAISHTGTSSKLITHIPALCWAHPAALDLLTATQNQLEAASNPKATALNITPWGTLLFSSYSERFTIGSPSISSVCSQPSSNYWSKFYLIFNCFCKVYPMKARQQASVKFDYFREHWGNLRCFSSLFGCKNTFQMFRNRKEKEILPRHMSACMKNSVWKTMAQVPHFCSRMYSTMWTALFSRNPLQVQQSVCCADQFYVQECGGVYFNSALKKFRATRTPSLHNMNAKCKSNLLHTDVDQQYLFKYW